MNNLQTINICIAGLGNVGSNLVSSIEKNNKLVKFKSSISFNILGVSASNKNKKRNFDLSKYQWFDDPMEMIEKTNCDVFIELIGSEKGISFDLVKKALQNGINVISANKALLAKHGSQLFKIASENNALLLFEAAVAGGIPIVKTIKNNIFLNNFKKISGILNGTTNYILTSMFEDNLTFEKALDLAKSKGYTTDIESYLDVDGLDSAHKLTLLSTLCFGAKINFNNNHIIGISDIKIEDMINANKLGYKIKLVSESYIKNSQIYCSTQPKLVNNKNPLANVDGVLNAIKIETDQLTSLFLEGEGAGGIATASSVISDLYELSSKSNIGSLGYNVSSLKKYKNLNINVIKSSYYIRIMTKDIAGVLSKITGFLNQFKISVEKIFQIPDNRNNMLIPIIITTHKIKKNDLIRAIKKIESQSFVQEKVVSIQIEQR